MYPITMKLNFLLQYTRAPPPPPHGLASCNSKVTPGEAQGTGIWVDY